MSEADESFVFKNSLNLEWKNRQAMNRFYQYSSMFGRPDSVIKSQGGMAVWMRVRIDDLMIPMMTIRDTNFTHTKPVRHMDYVFVTIKYQVKPCKIKGINKITGSAYYYPVGKELTSGCHFIGASIAAFYVIKEYNEDRMGLEEARQTYDILVMEFAKELGTKSGLDKMKITTMYSRHVLPMYEESDEDEEEECIIRSVPVVRSPRINVRRKGQGSST